MDNRVIRNQREFDYLARDEQRDLQEQLLRRLISHTRHHPLVADRLESFSSDIHACRVRRAHAAQLSGASR